MTRPDETTAPPTERIATSRLAVDFVFHNDRYIHEIALVDSGKRLVLARSAEPSAGRETDGAIPRQNDGSDVPVHQEAHFPRSDPGRTALLVGQSGVHHYSLSIHLIEDENRRRARIEFDHADRLARIPTEGLRDLSVLYFINLPIVDASEVETERVRWITREPSGVLTIETLREADRPTRIVVAEAGRRGAWIEIAPHPTTDAGRRCRYVWTWEET